MARGPLAFADDESYRKEILSESSLVYYCPDPGTGLDLVTDTSGAVSSGINSLAIGRTKGARFAAASNSVNAGNKANVAAGGAFTLEAWLSPSGSGNGVIVSKELLASPFSGYTFRFYGTGSGNQGKLYLAVNTNGANHYRDVTGVTQMRANGLYHVAAQLSAGEVYVFLNGADDSTGRTGDASVTSPADSSNNLTIGNAAEGGVPTNGFIGHVAIYNAALTATDFTRHIAAMLR